MVCISNDGLYDLLDYLRVRLSNKVKKVFLNEKGPLGERPFLICGIQKQLGYYARKNDLKISCHNLRHTTATQMLLDTNTPIARLSRISWGTTLLGRHNIIARISNIKVQRDYYKAAKNGLQPKQLTRLKAFQVGNIIDHNILAILISCLKGLQLE